MTNNTTAVIPTRNPTSETAGKTASTTLPITGSDPKNIWTAISAAIGPVADGSSIGASEDFKSVRKSR
jgi:hypothetical protein